MKKLIFLVFLSVFPCVVYAEILATIGWDDPDKRVDETPFSPDDIKEYRIYRTDGITPILVWSGTGGSHELMIPDGESHSYAVSVVDSNGIESKLSKYVSVSASAPKAPIIYFIRN